MHCVTQSAPPASLWLLNQGAAHNYFYNTLEHGCNQETRAKSLCRHTAWCLCDASTSYSLASKTSLITPRLFTLTGHASKSSTSRFP